VYLAAATDTKVAAMSEKRILIDLLGWVVFRVVKRGEVVLRWC
jgi:hypothetical protein